MKANHWIATSAQMPSGCSNAPRSDWRKRATAMRRGRKAAAVPMSASGDGEDASRKNGRTCPPSRSSVDGMMSRGEPSPSCAFFAKPCQTSAALLIHATVKGVRGVEEIGREAVRAEAARECDAVVQPVGDRSVTAGAFVSIAAHGEDLAASGGETRVGAGPHSVQRKEAEQDEVDQRDDELLHEPARLFAGHAADERGAALLDELDEARQRVGARDAHVGVHENKKRMVCERGELMAGEWLAAPAGGQWLRCFEAHARVASAEMSRTISAARSVEPSSRTMTSSSTSLAVQDGVQRGGDIRLLRCARG